MIKKTITFKDFSGVERTETHLFNLTEAEVMEMETSTAGGLSERIKRIVEAQDTPEIVKVFKELIHLSYGVKSDDGRRFIKNEEVLANFTQTEAYSKLFMELATDEKVAAEFVNGIVPENMDLADAKTDASTLAPLS